jgi:hypothetical protein
MTGASERDVWCDVCQYLYAIGHSPQYVQEQHAWAGANYGDHDTGYRVATGAK